MDQSEEREREIAELRDRLSRLSEASLRINESLDFDTVLQGVLDSARSLTEARYGVITLLDDSGRIADFLSSGMTAEEARLLWELPGGMGLFEYLGSAREPLRLQDLLGHVRSLGLPEFRPPLAVGPVVPFMAAPVIHRDELAGHLYVAEKEGGREFTPEDEETLVMFASQAALVIANARRHREEQRARARLETLIDTSPVGVAVFDARTGTPVSFNREAVRIIQSLRTPDSPPEQILETLSVRRADGREVSLVEFSLAQLLSAGETVRAEEIVMRTPDGRSVTALVNATPIRSEDGEVESFVVTLQDMTALEELERLRAEFLAMVSHELRMPLSSIKGSAATVLGAPSSLDPAEAVQFFRIIDSQADRMHDLIGGLLDVARIETGTLPVNPEPSDAASLVDEAKSAFLSGGEGNNLRIDLPPDLPQVMADRRRIVQVLGNLLSNAARHSQGSPIRVTAVQEGVHVAFSVADEGRGLSADLLPHLFRKFSRIDGGDRGSGIAGSGLGLAICKGIVEAHGGRIWAESDGPGLGARFTFTIPVAEGEGTGGAGTPAAPSVRSRRAIEGAGAHTRGGRRPPGAPVRARRPLQGGLLAHRHRRPAGRAAPHGGGEARPGPVGPDAAGERRDRPDEGHPGDGGRAGHLPVGVRPGGGDRQGLRHGGRRLRGQALLAHGAGGEDQGGPAQAGLARMGRSARTLLAGRPEHRLRRTPGDAGRASGAGDRDRV